MNKIKMSYISSDFEENEYPNDIDISVSFDGECTLKQAVQGFKMFLKAIEYSEKLVENIYYEDANKNPE